MYGEGGIDTVAIDGWVGDAKIHGQEPLILCHFSRAIYVTNDVDYFCAARCFSFLIEAAAHSSTPLSAQLDGLWLRWLRQPWQTTQLASVYLYQCNAPRRFFSLMERDTHIVSPSTPSAHPWKRRLLF